MLFRGPGRGRGEACGVSRLVLKKTGSGDCVGRQVPFTEVSYALFPTNEFWRRRQAMLLPATEPLPPGTLKSLPGERKE